MDRLYLFPSVIGAVLPEVLGRGPEYHTPQPPKGGYDLRSTDEPAFFPWVRLR